MGVQMSLSDARATRLNRCHLFVCILDAPQKDDDAVPRLAVTRVSSTMSMFVTAKLCDGLVTHTSISYTEDSIGCNHPSMPTQGVNMRQKFADQSVSGVQRRGHDHTCCHYRQAQASIHLPAATSFFEVCMQVASPKQKALQPQSPT